MPSLATRRQAVIIFSTGEIMNMKTPCYALPCHALPCLAKPRHDYDFCC